MAIDIPSYILGKEKGGDSGYRKVEYEGTLGDGFINVPYQVFEAAYKKSAYVTVTALDQTVLAYSKFIGADGYLLGTLLGVPSQHVSGPSKATLIDIYCNKFPNGVYGNGSSVLNIGKDDNNQPIYERYFFSDTTKTGYEKSPCVITVYYLKD